MIVKYENDLPLMEFMIIGDNGIIFRYETSNLWLLFTDRSKQLNGSKD